MNYDFLFIFLDLKIKNTLKTALSPIIAGTMNWGVWDKNLTTSEMADLINICLENKISTFDLADVYGSYTTEATFGKAFVKSKAERKNVQLISKCGIQHVCENRNNKLKYYDLSKDYIVWSVENSLKNLQTDYLDILLLHRPSPLMKVTEIAEAIEKLKKEGKILNFGLSNFTPSQTDLIRSQLEVNYNQIQFSVTNSGPMLDGSIDYMEMHTITPMAWNPLGTVFRENTDQTYRLRKLLATLVSKYHVGSDMILLAWILQHPAGIHPVAGTVNIVRIQSMAKIEELILDKEDWFAIWTESLGHKVP